MLLRCPGLSGQSTAALIVAMSERPSHLEGLAGLSAAELSAQRLERMLAPSPDWGLFDTLVMIQNPSREELRQAMRLITSRFDATHPNNALAIYYAGHVVQVDDRDNDEPDQLDEALVLRDSLFLDDEIRGWLTGLAPKFSPARLLFVADACHSASITRGAPADVALSFERPGPPGWTCVSAAADKEKALEVDGLMPLFSFVESMAGQVPIFRYVDFERQGFSVEGPLDSLFLGGMLAARALAIRGEHPHQEVAALAPPSLAPGSRVQFRDSLGQAYPAAMVGRLSPHWASFRFDSLAPPPGTPLSCLALDACFGPAPARVALHGLAAPDAPLLAGLPLVELVAGDDSADFRVERAPEGFRVRDRQQQRDFLARTDSLPELLANLGALTQLRRLASLRDPALAFEARLAPGLPVRVSGFDRSSDAAFRQAVAGLPICLRMSAGETPGQVDLRRMADGYCLDSLNITSLASVVDTLARLTAGLPDWPLAGQLFKIHFASLSDRELHITLLDVEDGWRVKNHDTQPLPAGESLYSVRNFSGSTPGEFYLVARWQAWPANELRATSAGIRSATASPFRGLPDSNRSQGHAPGMLWASEAFVVRLPYAFFD